MTTPYKELPNTVFAVIRGLASEETVSVFTQDSQGNLSPLDLTGKTVFLNLRRKLDNTESIVKTLSTITGEISVNLNKITLRVFSRVESLALPLKDLMGCLAVTDSVTRDVPLLFLIFKIQDAG